MRFEFGECHCKAGIPLSMCFTFKVDGPCRAEHRRDLKRAKTELTLPKKNRGNKIRGGKQSNGPTSSFFCFLDKID